MEFDTYFGFFAQSVFTALGATMSSLTGQPVSLDGLHLTTTNTLKLRWSNIDTVILPQVAGETQIKWLVALSAHDVAALNKLADGRIGLNKLMEQAMACAQEPFNFVHKRKVKLDGIQFSRNVTGLTAHHLDGEVSYTMAVGRFAQAKQRDFELRLLVTAQGRDIIEDRATQASTQRALFSINEGAYICRPQWEAPPPPPGMEEGAELNEAMHTSWVQTFLGKNDGSLINRLFQRTAGLTCMDSNTEALSLLADTDGPPTVVRLRMNDRPELELFTVLGEKTTASLLKLSKSGHDRFIGEFFRVLYGDSAQIWSQFGDTPLNWKLLAARRIPADAMDAVSKRVEGGGLVLKQFARVDEGFIDWLVAIPPHTWHWMMKLTAQGMAHPTGGQPNRQGIFSATGWGKQRVPWSRMAGLISDTDTQNLIRVLQQASMTEAHMAAVAAGLQGAPREQWLEALPVSLRERTQAYRLADGEADRRLAQVTSALVTLHRAQKLPQGKLADWGALYAEYLFAFRQHLIDKVLPLRHLIYGMDRESLTRILFDVPNDLVVDVLCWAEFPVVDQIRRAIPPRFAMRLLEDVGARRLRLNAFAAQEAQLTFYRRCLAGATEGRYLLRATPATRLREIFRQLEVEV